jgi:hypothetical protein
MTDWVANEMRASQLNDKRLNRRLSVILESLSENPQESIPAACQGWTETHAVYRFLDNDNVSLEEILSGHKSATMERIRNQQMVLLAQDTTFLDFGQEESVGLGTLKRRPTDHYLLHPTVAFTPSRVNLGVLGAKLWQRPEEPVGHLRRKKPIEEKESYRWLESYDLACEVQRNCPQTLVVSIADREGDIHEWFSDAQSRPLEEKAEFIVRAKCNRRTEVNDEEYSYLWEELTSCPCIGKRSIQTPRNGNRRSRTADIEIRTKEILFCGRKGQARDPVSVFAVYAKEKRAPKGEEAIEWMLLTSIPVENVTTAQAIVEWYRCRWEIEIFFRVLKQGCQIERLRLETDTRLLNAIAVYIIVGWRIHTITMQSREWPKVDSELIFTEREWKTIYLMQTKKKPPKQAPDLQTITRMLAQLGGFLARKGDGEPGVKNIWRGYRALQNYIDALDMAQVAL